MDQSPQNKTSENDGNVSQNNNVNNGRDPNAENDSGMLKFLYVPRKISFKLIKYINKTVSIDSNPCPNDVQESDVIILDDHCETQTEICVIGKL